MNNTHRFKLDKLVRDKFPEIMESKHVSVSKQILKNEDEFICSLKNKISEEIEEAINAKNESKRIEELADTLEAFHCLCSIYNLSYHSIEEVRNKKQLEKGSYSFGIYVDSIEMDNDNSLAIKYLSQLEKYPEIDKSK